MRPIASTWVASMQNIAAPDSASVLICVKCQSLAAPSTAEYWHIGATMMRLESARPRRVIGENSVLMGVSGWEGSVGKFYSACRAGGRMGERGLFPSPLVGEGGSNERSEF